MCSGFRIVVTDCEWLRVEGGRKVENNGEKIAEKIEEMEEKKIRCSNFFTCLFRKFR